MASFAAYASQYLNRQQNPAESSLASSQPLFFSFTDDGSRSGPHAVHGPFDDDDDPHLRESGATTRGRPKVEGVGDDDSDSADDEDPYLRLDEDDHTNAGSSRYAPQSVPLLGASHDTSTSKGWLAHHGAAPRSPSPSPSITSSSSDEGIPPASLFSPTKAPPARPGRGRSPPRARAASPPPPPPRAQQIALSLTESLLPRDGRTRPLDVFSLPDPRHTTRGRRKHHDAPWLALWLTGVGVCVLGCMLVLIFTHTPKGGKSKALPYTTLLHTVPLLIILTFVSAAVSYGHIFLLRIFVRPVMIATTVFIPATLLISSLWAFIGSFMWDANTEPTWGETVGLRLFAIIPFILALITARRILTLPQEMHTTSALLNLCTRILLQQPFLLALSPAILLIALLGSLPFLTLAFRLLLVGGWSRSGSVWRVRTWADWAIVGDVIVWLWSWGVARGVMRVAAAGAVGSWYFADPQMPPPPPTSTHTIHAALYRATQPSLGSTCLSALILAGIRILSLSATFLRTLPAYLPLAARAYVTPAAVALGYGVAWLERWTGVRTLSVHALVYVGLTGDAFMPAARRARALVGTVEGNTEGTEQYRRKFQTETPLMMLTVAPLTLTFPFALITYLFVAHTLGSPASALGAALLAGGVTALVGLFCVGLVKDVADALYICYCIDKDMGLPPRPDVLNAFKYASRPATHRGSSGLPAPVTQPARRAPPIQASIPPPQAHQPLREYPDYTPPSSRSSSPSLTSDVSPLVPTLAGAGLGSRVDRLSDSSDDVPPASFMHENPRSPPHAEQQSPPQRVPGDLEQGGGEADLSGVFGLQASTRTQTDVDESEIYPGSDLF